MSDLTAFVLSYHVIHDAFVLFTFAKVEVIFFDTFVSDHISLALELLGEVLNWLATRNESVPKIIINDSIIFAMQSAFW